MIDFACKQFNLDELIKCGFGLTRKELQIMKYFLKYSSMEFTTVSIAEKLELNLTTVQKAVKKLSEKKIILRRQKNLEKGGYIFTYECSSKNNIRKILKGIISNWFQKVEKNIDEW